MLLARTIKSAALALGVELRRHDVAYSEHARFFQLLRTKQIDLVLDVGANGGEYGEWLRAGGYRGAILSFEPLAAAYAQLERAAAAHPPWQLAPRAAVGAADGTIEINVAGNSVSSSILPMERKHLDAAPESRFVAVEKVPLMRLDGFSHPSLDAGRAILLKIDTQGYEMPVLEGAERLLERVTGVQIELSLTPLYAGQALYRTVLDWLAARGFGLWGVMPGFVDRESGRLLQLDGLLFRD
jgi:FkbM family methyltransferase